MTSTLPQHSYFIQEYSLNSTNWKLSGHSRALERTGFLLTGGGGRILLDAGIDIPDFSSPDIILLTHSHIDHCNSLPMLYRLTSSKSLVHIFTPSTIINRIRQFVSLSFSIKVDDNSPIPDYYQAPELYTSPIYKNPIYSPQEENSHRWHPITPGLNIPVDIGRNGKKTLYIQTVKLYHTVSTVGYIISEKRTKLRPDLNKGDKKLTNECVAAARSRGEEVTIEISHPICSYLCDTTARVLYNPNDLNLVYPVPQLKYPHATINDNIIDINSQSNSNSEHQEHHEHKGQCGGECGGDVLEGHSFDKSHELELNKKIEENTILTYNTEEILKTILSTPIIMIECTYLHNDMEIEAEKRGHVVWSYLRPVVINHFTSKNNQQSENNSNDENVNHNNTFILFHFSLRYSDIEITSFFMNSNECGLLNPSQTPPDDNVNLPPHLILWLDTGIVRLWYHFS